MVWSQSTVRGKLSLGKERKWDTRRTHIEGDIERRKYKKYKKYKTNILGDTEGVLRGRNTKTYTGGQTEVQKLTEGFR